MPPIRALAAALLTLAACSENHPSADAGLPDGSLPADGAVDAPADGMPADQALVDRALVVDGSADQAAVDQGMVVSDASCDAETCGPPPDAYAGADCPCPALAALAAECPAAKCTIGDWRPSGLGEGFMRDAELRAMDSHLCARLIFQRGYTFRPDDVTIVDGATMPNLIASYTGLDYRPGAPHVLTCGDKRAFFGVTGAQCPALAHLWTCGGPDGGAP